MTWDEAESRSGVRIPDALRAVAEELSPIRQRCGDLYLCSPLDVVVGTLRWRRWCDDAKDLIAVASEDEGWAYVDPSRPEDVGYWSLESQKFRGKWSLPEFIAEFDFALTLPIFRRDAPPRGSIGLSRADSYYERILAPIGVAEWDAAVNEDPDLRPVVVKNPFTGESIDDARFRRATAFGVTVQFTEGGASTKSCEETEVVFERLASRLGATVFR